MIHAAAMVDIAEHIVFADGVLRRSRRAACRRPIICDSEMVKPWH